MMVPDWIAYWVLPSLIILLLLLQTGRYYEAQSPSDLNLLEWSYLIAVSILFPTGLIAFLSMVTPSIIRSLLKERKIPFVEIIR